MTTEATLKNSDILFIYDATLCNPNGDPDEENRPRMDDATGRNLVSDVRLKRYLRDYWAERKPNDPPVWVSRVNGQPVKADTRYSQLKETFTEKNAQPDKDVEAYQEELKTWESNLETWLLQKLKDIRYFGATITTEKPRQYTGPVQFTWAHSLNRVEIVPSSTISSTFSGAKEGEPNLGKDWRVYYSLIAFHGIVSGRRAKHTQLTEQDIEALDNDILKAVCDGASTRSKIGQMPRLYMRVEYKNNSQRCIRDMRPYLRLTPVGSTNLDTLRNVSDYVLNISALLDKIKSVKENVHKIVVFQDDELRTGKVGESSDGNKMLEVANLSEALNTLGFDEKILTILE